jgi:hypothetical protein
MPDTTDIKYPDIHVQLTGQDGNPIVVLFTVCKEMKKAGVPQEEQDAFRAEALSGDYDQLLQTCMKWVHVS